MSGTRVPHQARLGSAPYPAQIIARLATHRSGQFLLSGAVALICGALMFALAGRLGMSRASAWVVAGLIALSYFAYSMVIVKLRVLHYFGRPHERIVERALAPATVLVVVVGWLATGSVTFSTAAVMVAAVILGTYFALSPKQQGDLRYGAVYPRSDSDARAMLALAQAQPLPSRAKERFMLRLNTAHALVALAESEQSYRQLQEAYDLLHELAYAAADSEPEFRIVVLEGLVEVTSKLHSLGDDLRIYEEAALLLDQEVSQQRGVPVMDFRRFLNRSDLAYMRSGIPARRTMPAPGRIRALDEAVHYLRQALPVAPRQHRAQLHFRLAIHLSVLAELKGDLTYLTQAIAEARLALAAITWATREQQPAIELVLADMLTDLVRRGGAGAEALAEADQVAGQLRSASDADTRAWAWVTLIPIRQLRLVARADPAEFRAQFDTARREGMAAAPSSQSRIWLAVRLGSWAAEEGQAASAAWAYGEALATARRLSVAGLVRPQQQGPLALVRGVAAEATHWLLESGLPQAAVTTLESSRALVLGAAVGREVLIRWLEQRDPQLARRCAELSDQLARADTGRPMAGAPGALLWSGAAARRAARLAQEQWRSLAGWLSQCPELRILLDGPGYGHVAAAARRRPLVYVVAANECGYALVVGSGADDPVVVRLPELTSDRAREQAEALRAGSVRLGEPAYDRTQWHDTLADCVHWLRAAVMRILVRQLPASGGVCLIAAGDLGLLPLHAAGALEVPALVWTYSPSAHVLGHAAEAARQAVTRASRALLVMTSGGGAQLRHSRSVEPVLRRHLPRVTALAGRAAKRDPVLAALHAQAVLHFTGHGAADGEDPLESYLQLSDGRVTVRDLLDQRLRARLAVLAACETAVPYAHLPDEVIGLPAALLEAGVPGVVGAQWPVQELPTLLLTSRFYELWLGRGNEPAFALHLAQQWLRTATAGDLEAYAQQRVDPSIRWPVRSTGKARQHKVFAHPDCWAAFAYTGV